MGNLKEHVEKLFAISEIDRAGSISKAATRLKISQPALSQSLQTLEDVLGFQVFVRSPKGSTLTDEGKRIVRYCRKLELELKSLEESLQEPELSNDQLMLLGMPDGFARSFWPKLVSQKISLEPGEKSLGKHLKGRIAIQADEPQNLQESLLHHEIHVYLSDYLPFDPRLQVIPFELSYGYEFFANQQFISKFGLHLHRGMLPSCPVASYLNDEADRGKILMGELYQLGFECFPFDFKSYEAAAALAKSEPCLAVLPSYFGVPEELHPVCVEGSHLLPQKQFCLVMLAKSSFLAEQQNVLNLLLKAARRFKVNQTDGWKEPVSKMRQLATCVAH